MHPTLLYYWYRTPVLRPVLALSAGIITQWYTPFSLFTLYLIAALTTVLWLVIFLAPDRWQRLAGPTSLLAGGSLFFLGGVFLCISNDIRNDPRWLGNDTISGSGSSWECLVVEEPIQKKRSYALTAMVLARHFHNQRYPQHGKLLVYLPNDQQATRLRPGDTIKSDRPPLLIAPPQNPGERNWQQAYLMKGVTHRIFLRPDEYRIISGDSSFSFRRNLWLLKKKILGILQRYISDPAAAGLAKALLIGYRQDLDPALSRSYGNTGVIHIIAISGMHLALIGGLLGWCLRPLERWRPLKQLTQLLILGSLWLFSLLAGGAPSLLRATLLFSTIVMGQLLKRQGNTLNNLMVSALLLLCYDPFWLWDLGFQLSFAAVAGIILTGRYLSRQLSHVRFWWHAPGQLIAISIAAQWLTTPLSLYHFHQFPGAFLIGNLVAVPLSNIVLTGLLLLMVFSPFPLPATLIGKAVEWLIGLMNQYIKEVERIPGLLLTDLHWNLSETILLFIFLLALLHWIINQSTTGRILSISVGLSLISWQAGRLYLQRQQQLIVIYQLNGMTAIDWITGTHCYSRIDSLAASDRQQLHYTLRQSRLSYGIRQIVPLPTGQQVRLGQKRIWMADKQRIPPRPDSTLIDLLVISRRSPYDGKDWVCGRKIGKAVIDGSTGTRTREQWTFLLDSLGIAVHDTKRAGAFVSSLR
jgi:competence protein ComEC